MSPCQTAQGVRQHLPPPPSDLQTPYYSPSGVRPSCVPLSDSRGRPLAVSSLTRSGPSLNPAPSGPSSSRPSGPRAARAMTPSEGLQAQHSMQTTSSIGRSVQAKSEAGTVHATMNATATLNCSSPQRANSSTSSTPLSSVGCGREGASDVARLQGDIAGKGSPMPVVGWCVTMHTLFCLSSVCLTVNGWWC